MHLTKELFVIPHGEAFILYAPLKRAVAEVNADMVLLLRRVQAGEESGTWRIAFLTCKESGSLRRARLP